MSPEMELIRQWLGLAQEDLRGAELALAGQPPVCGVACFHCQQAVEKALKAFLIYRQIDFQWSHLIAYLLDLCIDQDDSFQQLQDAAPSLSQYAVRIRYPYAGPRPTAEESQAALEVAGQVYRFVLERLPEETHPAG